MDKISMIFLPYIKNILVFYCRYPATEAANGQ